MLAKREKQLLVVLIVVAALCAVGMGTALGVEALGTARERAAQYEEQVRRLSESLTSEASLSARRDLLKAELDRERAHFYSPGEMNPYLFGTLVRQKLSTHGIAVIRYQVVEEKSGNSVEFSVSGNIRSLVLFLKEVSDSTKYWTISSMTLNMSEGGSDFTAVFRIGYGTLDSQNS